MQEATQTYENKYHILLSRFAGKVEETDLS
jgi:hypothetical protein